MRFHSNAWWSTCILLLAAVCAGAETHTAYWELSRDALERSEAARHALNHGVVFDVPAPDGTPAARFDGRGAYLEVPAGLAPDFGAADFSISMRVYTEPVMDDAPGDLIGCYDPQERRGFNLGIASWGGVSNSQPNFRHLHFGIDNGRTDPEWTDCGRPGNAVLVFGFAVHEDALYAATCEPDAGEAGGVYRYEGGQAWASCGSPDDSNAVAALAVHGGALYAGTGWYDTTGSSLAASPNTTPGGRVYRYGGGAQWTFCGALSNPETGTAATMGGLAVFRGELYATTLKQDGFGLYRYEGGTQWAYCGNPGRRVLNPFAFNGKLYMVSYDAPGGPFTYDGETWAYAGGAIDPPIHQDYSFAAYGGRLHLSTWPDAHVYRMEEDGGWTLCGKPADELETMGMMVYNGKLYAGALPSARVYRYDAPDTWTPVGQPLDTTETRYRRAWSMALFEGRLYCGTLPSGKVFSLEAGKNATSGRELAPGWRHVRAARRDGRLSLYVDGERIAESAPFEDSHYDLSNGQPLFIGLGAGDFFNGWMKDLEIHWETPKR
jgi:hypothetical protein